MLWVTVAVTFLLAAWFIYFSFGQVPGKTLTVAQAAYRQTIRQPLFWFLLAIALLIMFFLVFLPYFTLGEDLKMMKALDLDTILFATLVLSVFTASVSISEEIEGRTAITLLSKPMSRRQYLVGKYVGILTAALLMALVLSVFMGRMIEWKIDLDKLERPGDPPEIAAMERSVPSGLALVLRPILRVFAELQHMAPGVVMNCFQVAIVTAVAVALATRLPMLVNLVVCVVIFAVGRLTHVLEAQAENPLVKFVAQIFATLLPGFNYYDVGPAIVNDVEVPWGGYVAHAAIHGLIYISIALFFGLVLFEDRDLA
jgi:hypothetical protein